MKKFIGVLFSLGIMACSNNNAVSMSAVDDTPKVNCWCDTIGTRWCAIPFSYEGDTTVYYDTTAFFDQSIDPEPLGVCGE